MYSMLRSVLIGLCYLFIATNVFTIFSNPPGINADPRYAFEPMLRGEAARPFVYRALTPQLTRWLSKGIPDSVFAVYEKYRWNSWMEQELLRSNTDLALAKEWILYSWVAILCFAGLGWVLQALLRFFYPESWEWSHLWGLLGLSFVPILFDFHGQIYDPAAVVIFPFAFLALVKGYRTGYYFLFILAVWNKETAVLLIGFYVIYTWPQRRWLDWVGQAVIYGVITGWLRWVFNDNPGGTVESQLRANLEFVTTPSIILFTTWMKLGVLTLMLVVGWSKRPKVLRYYLVLSLLVLGPLWVVFGRFAEIRGFLECYFILFLLAYPNLQRLLRTGLAQSSTDT